MRSILDHYFARGDNAPAPIDYARLRIWPRHGMNISGLLVSTAGNIPETLKRYVDAGVQLTDVNWLSALWAQTDCLPFRIPAPGVPFDLFDWDNRFFERAHEIVETFNAQGIVVQGTWWETYSWSNRKRGSGVPDANVGPWRHNINGIRLGGAYNGDRKQDDETLTKLIPTPFCRAFIPRILKFWNASINPVRLGNELPEKGLHERLRDLVRANDPKALVIVNRQEDTPGQYDNMHIGRDYDRIELHGAQLKSVPDLSRLWSKEDSHVPSYVAMMNDPKTQNWRITFSSDGARSGPGKDGPTDPYVWDELKAFFRTVKGRGGCVLHQSRAKMTLFPNHGMIESDWFGSVIK